MHNNKFALRTCLPCLGLFGLFAVILLWGCGSVVDSDYQEYSGEGRHPFEEDRNHGIYLTSGGGDLMECTVCHGADLRGVDNGARDEDGDGEHDRSCYECHNAEDHLVPFTGTDRDHTAWMRAHNWDLEACYPCHANTESERRLTLGESCNSGQCHSDSPLGPQACNTCHGNPVAHPSDPINWAPPQDLAGEESVQRPSVGMHQAHVAGLSGNTKKLDCQVCHDMPQTWQSAGHIDSQTPGQAEVVFHYPATKGNSDPMYDRATNNCSVTYCHGEGSKNWVGTASQTDCSSCHGMPPAVMHPQWPTLNQCYYCHGSMIDADGNITNPKLHVNGGVN